MISKILDFFRSEDDNDPSFIRMTRNILLFVILVLIAILPLVTGITGETARNPLAFVTILITLALEGVSLFFVMRQKVLMAKIVVPLALIITVIIIALHTNGLKNTSLVGLPVILVISAILLGRRALFIVTPLAIIAVIIVAVADLNNTITVVPAGLDDAIIIPVLLLGCGSIIQLLITRLDENIRKARESERSYIQENRELTELRSTLEERVNQRTIELDSANRFNQKRARQFEAIAQVVHVISSIQDLDSLLPRIAQVISEQFDTYHTGIFLLDDKREYAILRASNSDGGRRMLEREHKLQIGQTGIVGFVAATGQPRIALDVGLDAVFFDNPDLPNTHSEIALPLRYGGQIIGVLDVQSTESNAFGQDDVEVLVALADQVSIAINNTLTIEQALRSLSESQSATGQSARKSWKAMRPKSLGLGFQLTGSKIVPLESPLEGGYIEEAISKGEMIISNEENESSNLAIPIRLRGQIIGVMNLRTQNNRRITKDDSDIAEAVSERLSLAIETATLLQATQHRADIERVTTNISSKISASTRFETILQTAAQELSRALGGSDVLVQIEPVSIELGMSS